MLGRIFAVSIGAFFLILIDLYIYQAVRTVTHDWSPGAQRAVWWTFWGITGLAIGGLYYFNFGQNFIFGKIPRSLIIAGIFVTYFSKFFGVLFLFVDDAVRLGKWVAGLFQNPTTPVPDGQGITRSEFLAKSALVSVAVPLTTFAGGIAMGAYNYKIRRTTVPLKNLPKAFDGVRIAQLSDIHSGSFFNRKAVEKGVNMLMEEKPDLFFFTGDLVNYQADEFGEYFDVFKKIKAPLGSYSILGNHDYGDYSSWSSVQAKRKNLETLILAHREMGWDILLNENRTVKVDGEEIAILGCENWGRGRFAKYGDIEKTYEGTQDIPVKLMLSHDPSHWDAQIRTMYPDVDITFAGHTHGFQFGVEIGGFKWSPSQYYYKQWAGLYQEDEQFLYVNRGFGFIGYPGRVGILPEITILELKSV